MRTTMPCAYHDFQTHQGLLGTSLQHPLQHMYTLHKRNCSGTLPSGTKEAPFFPATRLLNASSNHFQGSLPEVFGQIAFFQQVRQRLSTPRLGLQMIQGEVKLRFPQLQVICQISNQLPLPLIAPISLTELSDHVTLHEITLLEQVMTMLMHSAGWRSQSLLDGEAQFLWI